MGGLIPAMENEPVTIAFLGTGLMGFGMAGVLAREGFDLRVWNRTAAKAEPLAEDGARVCADVGDAVDGADVVITMLFDVDAVLEVMTEAAPRLGPDTVWVQASTVGIDGATRIVDFAAEHGLALLDAPVLGTKKPAAEGQLVWLVSGDPDLRPRVQPALDATGSTTIWVDETVGKASALKLVCNAWVLSVTAGAAQSIALAQSLGLDPQLFLDAIAGGAVDTPYAHLKGTAIIDGDFTASFPVDGGSKDLALIAAAAEVGSGIDGSIIDAVRQAFARASERGHGDDDLAGVYFGIKR